MKLLLSISSLFFSIISFAQTVSPLDSTIHSCNYKSTNILFTDIAIDTVYYGNHTSANYKDAQYRQLTQCGDMANHCITDQDTALVYYVYYPVKHNYIITPLPCIMIEHGGSFSDCSGIQIRWI